MLPTRDPPLDRTPTQTQSEGLETNIPSKWTGKQSRGSNTHIIQIDFRRRAIKGAPIRLATYFSVQTFQARREWEKIFQVMRTTGLQPRLLYVSRLSVRWKAK